ncbi:MAG: DNA-3-methyladenine glycosylase I [Bradyrhizobium sp.]|nr:MAG: DNA-3-methyladenine glycosylase I [Bradyrhizobium sp.]
MPAAKKPAPPPGVHRHDDGRHRCPWPGVDPLYVAYHDEEWGAPEWDDRALFEKLVLDGFQAGLSWITILRKREAFRAAFDGFEPERIVRYDSAKVAALMGDAGIVRNRAKIEATIKLAHIALDLNQQGGFARHLWSFVDGRPIDGGRRSMRDIPPETAASLAMSKDLRARGARFVGPTIVYAFMQATGMVNDHLADCHRHAACAALAKDAPW